MGDLRGMLERGVGGFKPSRDGLEATMRRVGRRRRNRRLIAGTVALAITAAGAGVAWNAFVPDRALAPRPAKQPAVYPPSMSCGNPPFWPRYLPWSSSGRPEVGVEGRKRILTWRSHDWVVTLTRGAETPANPEIGDTISVRNTSGRAIWAGDPGLSELTLGWTEGADPCDRYTLSVFLPDHPAGEWTAELEWIARQLHLTEDIEPGCHVPAVAAGFVPEGFDPEPRQGQGGGGIDPNARHYGSSDPGRHITLLPVSGAPPERQAAGTVATIHVLGRDATLGEIEDGYSVELPIDDAQCGLLWVVAYGVSRSEFRRFAEELIDAAPPVSAGEACRAADLRVEPAWRGALGSTGGTWTFTNIGTTECTLSPQVRVRLIGPDGGPAAKQGPYSVKLAYLAPGGAAEATILVSAPCNAEGGPFRLMINLGPGAGTLVEPAPFEGGGTCPELGPTRVSIEGFSPS